MTVTIYRSTDASAPSLTGQVGSLITVLDAILVNGYGSKAAVGCTKPYSGTNTAVYRMPTGNQRYLNVDDTGGSGNNYARVTGYEAMTAVATGTGLFPSAVTSSGGFFCAKSSTADATVRPWVCYSNGVIFYFFVACDGSTTLPTSGGFIFGDFISYVPGDTYNTCLLASSTNALTTSLTQNSAIWAMYPHASATSLLGFAICRNYLGIGTSLGGSKFTNSGFWPLTVLSTSPIGIGYPTLAFSGANFGGTMAFPNGADGALYFERFWICESTGTIRGEFPGWWCPLNGINFNHLDQVTPTAGPLAGKTLEAWRAVSPGAAQAFMEVSNTW